MKLSGKKELTEPELVWGNKYRMARPSGGFEQGDIVLLLSSKIDGDGEVQVATEKHTGQTGWVEPIYLEEINQETLYPTDKEEDTLLVEISFKELETLSDCIDKAKVYSGYGLSSKKYADEVKESLDGLQKEIEDILRTKVNY